MGRPKKQSPTYRSREELETIAALNRLKEPKPPKPEPTPVDREFVRRLITGPTVPTATCTWTEASGLIQDQSDADRAAKAVLIEEIRRRDSGR